MKIVLKINTFSIPLYSLFAKQPRALLASIYIHIEVTSNPWKSFVAFLAAYDQSIDLKH